MSLLKKLSILALIIFPVAVLALSLVPGRDYVVSQFKYYKDISPDISKTSVVEVPFNEESFSISSFAVYNLTTNTNFFEPYFLSVNRIETGSEVQTNGVGDSSSINDGRYDTFVEFPLNEESGRAEIVFNFDKAITASSLSFALDEYVALPRFISVNANVAGGDSVVLAPVKPSGGNIVFPKTTSSVWRVVFDYVQPLRVSEMKFNDTSPGQVTTRGLRFLAQPGQSYRIYFDADRYMSFIDKESGDLSSDKDVVVYSSGAETVLNPEYIPLDSDSDGVPNLVDNCVNVSNAGQKDSDENGLGDACEDYDRDGIVNAKDNCSDIPNVSQVDTDKDNIGDVCDTLDNRVTERMPWLPWIGIGLAGGVILALFVVVLRHKKIDNQENLN